MIPLLWQIFLRGFFSIRLSASTSNIARIEEMERLLKQAHAEKTRLLESRVRQSSCQDGHGARSPTLASSIPSRP